jgi:crossover junction endodeoxyribonuclease RuvC
MKPDAYIGIDPGKDGAMVALDSNGDVISAHLTKQDFTIQVGKGSKREYLAPRMAFAINCISKSHNVRLAVLEKQHAMPGQGVTSMFSCGYGYGLWVATVASHGIPLTEVRATTWIKSILAGVPGEGKGRSIYAVTSRLPKLDLTPGAKRKPHDGLADAACMAMYAHSLKM